MAKDDYNVIKFKILVYLYGILKRRYTFTADEFNNLLERNNINDEYFIDILELMLEESLIKNITISTAMGGHKFINSDISNVKITARVINHLEENKLMNKIKENALSSLGLLGEFVKKVLL